MRARARPLAAFVAAAPCALGCGVPPPPSQFPSGQAALDRMHATYDCVRGVRGDAKIDFFSEKGRVRGGLMLFAIEPERVRFDAISPFGVTLSTLTSDGRDFSLFDIREKRFYEGRSTTCNVARLTHVPIPVHALVDLLHGEAPVLVHQAAAATVRWSSRGYYEVEVPSTKGATESIRLAPVPADFDKPFGEQRVKVTDVRVEQQGYLLYHAELGDHANASTAAAIIDDEGIDAPVPPSGPQCTAEVPRSLHVTVAASGDDVILRYKEVSLNPPLPEGTFTQPVPGGVQVIPSGPCE